MQQRVSLCRALIHQPALLMLDEPFASLDAFTREELWCVLRDLWQKLGFTVILVTHDLREATFLADNVHVMSARPGRIVMTKTIDLPRPRDLDICFEPRFTDIVHELRAKIAEVPNDFAGDQPPVYSAGGSLLVYSSGSSTVAVSMVKLPP